MQPAEFMSAFALSSNVWPVFVDWYCTFLFMKKHLLQPSYQDTQSWVGVNLFLNFLQKGRHFEKLQWASLLSGHSATLLPSISWLTSQSIQPLVQIRQSYGILGAPSTSSPKTPKITSCSSLSAFLIKYGVYGVWIAFSDVYAFIFWSIIDNAKNNLFTIFFF